jgi:hypothetical protein
MHKKCPHGKQKYECVQCGGNGICVHNRKKSTCKECGGNNICVHNRQKSQCKECGGSQICVHNRRKSTCKECGGNQICEHGRRKSQCIECGGSQICIHKRQKSQCKLCSDPIKITIIKMMSHSKSQDKKCNIYDVDNFIDKESILKLINDYPICPYCEVELQYIERNNTLASIERLNNSIGHIKSNCIICCLSCNCKRIGNQNNAEA